MKTGGTIAALGATGLIGLGFAGATFAAPGGKPGMAQEAPDFATIDANGDGSITPDELRAMETSRFAEMDTNGDGSLDKDELLAAMTAEASERAGKMLDRMIAWNDADGDGALSESEMPGKDRGNMLSRADADGDGAISADEFEQAMAKHAERGGKRGQRGEGGKRGDGDHGKGGHGQGGKHDG